MKRTILSTLAFGAIASFIPVAALANTMVTVDSEPRGASVTIEGPNNVSYFDAVTPARITDLPIQQVIVHYGDLPGCITPKPQTRVISEMIPIHFFGRYDCSPKPAQAPAAPVITNDSLMGQAGIKLSPHQTEVLPGGQVRYTLAVHNLSKTTQNDFTVTFQYDTSEMNITETLPYGGMMSADGLVVWEVPVLFAGQTWSVSFPVNIDQRIKQGQRIYTSARASSPDLIADASDQTSTKLATRVMVGTPVIPPTGARFELLFLLLSTLCAFSLALLNVRRSS